MVVGARPAPRSSNPNGHSVDGQMYVQHFALDSPITPWPVLLWHGGGMTGVTWETTPDGRPGWHDLFMRRGFDTYVSDAVHRGRASWPTASAIHADTFESRTIEQAWDLFRFGEAAAFDLECPTLSAFEGQQFPVEAIASLARQFVPRWVGRKQATLAAYEALLTRTGPAIVITHSEGARYAMELAVSRPQWFKAVVLVEPAGAPDVCWGQAFNNGVTKPAFCVVWGDHFAHSQRWQHYRASAESWLDRIRAAAAQIDVIDLPQLGIRGNSHLPMMDRNSDEVAQRLVDWLGQHAI